MRPGRPEVCDRNVCAVWWSMLGCFNVSRIVIFRFLAPRLRSRQSPPSRTSYRIYSQAFSPFQRTVHPYRGLAGSVSFCNRSEKRVSGKCVMPKKDKTSVQSKGAAKEAESPSGPVVRDKSGLLCIAVHAKPGSRQNAVTAVSERAVDVSVAAPPSDGEANAELIRYLCRVLELKKGHVVLDKGCRSREKKIKISSSLSPEEVLEKLRREAAS